MGYARKEVEKTKKLAKKFVRYQEGAELYSIGLTKFQELAKEAKAVYKMELLGLKGSGASKLLSNLVQADIIEPVSGHGKGKYKFKK